ncbi:hypothetical protein SeMB42_g04690 [Synchytrium endobioticum]|uniref:Cilia- and flagella-associated protein 52 n=1 Tax=Synchytrium endobioticum TaxID=286115 RepID=A0A507CYW7_9FUNG|nr:hypothetical protein SeMB42_g04690 [Synchytrium endobioticum]TPX44372.1 hypothetical protein SeLEV6574_g04539 [Synchytrium endobioticum]
MAHTEAPVKHLDLQQIIGFCGSVPGGLIKHPDGIHLLYPLGSTVVVTTSSTSSTNGGGRQPKQEFLQGHTNAISCLAVSKDGKLIASGQVTHMGFQADIIIWDFETRRLLRRLALHKVKVQALAFSFSAKFLASLGGEDDNSVIVWDLTSGSAICGAAAAKDSSGTATCLAYLNNDERVFVTGGAGSIRVWELSELERKVRAQDCQTGQIKRIVKCLAVDENDEFVYCGTTTGDLMQVNLRTKLFKLAGPPKEKDFFSLGIRCATILPKEESVIVGCGDGTIATLKLPTLKIVQSTKLQGSVTSISLDSNNTFLAGTITGCVYVLDMETYKAELKWACHHTAVNDVCFPPESSDLFATASDSDVRIWNAITSAELVRVVVPNLECKCVVFNKEGSSLITGWNDGKIRSFGPQSGRLQFEINDAHRRCVTAVAVTDVWNDRGDYKIVSGGDDGQVRIWAISRQVQTLEEAMKEHKGTVTCIKIRRNNNECVSSSSDGSCIVWDLTRRVRSQVLFAPSFFKAVVYYPDESQLLTSGTDRKVAYWEAYDGSLIRELEVSQADAVNGLDITPDGRFFVMGGSDKLVKVYKYEEGDVAAVGVGHSTDVTKVRVAPNGKYMVSVSAEGAVMSWDLSNLQ